MDQSVVSRILFATDFSESARLAQAYTEYLAVAFKASVIVFHVTERPSSPETGPKDQEIQSRLHGLQEKIRECLVTASVRRSIGNAGDEIVAAAHQLHADMISMGMQGETHVPYGLIGATAQTVTTGNPCPVLTVPLPVKQASPCAFTAPDDVRIQRILAPVDFSDPSLDSLECAIQLAHRLRADLVLLHVVEPAHADWDLHRMKGAAQMRHQWDARLGDLAAVVKSSGLSATYDVRTGVPSDSILAGALQHRCDLIVMGTHGRRGRERTNVGSVAEAVLKQSSCPVLTVKNPKFARRPAIQTVFLTQSDEAAMKGTPGSIPRVKNDKGG
ncbi:MAG TPA: universal stress protein [Nitrospira sp.]|nr:universal stress protein [Nitrospira sp.]